MNHLDAHSDDYPYFLTSLAVEELERVTELVDRLEVQLCLHSLRLEHAESPQAKQAIAMARQIGDVYQTLQDIQTFGL